MPLSIDLHVKCPFYKKWNKKKTPIFLSWNFYTVFREQIAIFYQIFKSGSSKIFFKCPQFTKVISLKKRKKKTNKQTNKQHQVSYWKLLKRLFSLLTFVFLSYLLNTSSPNALYPCIYYQSIAMSLFPLIPKWQPSTFNGIMLVRTPKFWNSQCGWKIH